MSVSQLVDVLALPAPTSAEDVTHTVCCDEDRAICGTDVTGQRWGGVSDPTTCPVCAEAEWRPCPDNGSRGTR